MQGKPFPCYSDDLALKAPLLILAFSCQSHCSTNKCQTRRDTRAQASSTGCLSAPCWRLLLLRGAALAWATAASKAYRLSSLDHCSLRAPGNFHILQPKLALHEDIGLCFGSHWPLTAILAVEVLSCGCKPTPKQSENIPLSAPPPATANEPLPQPQSLSDTSRPKPANQPPWARIRFPKCPANG